VLRGILLRLAATGSYGWGKRERFGREMLEQNGRIPIGYASYAGLSPKDIVVIVLNNIQSEGPARFLPISRSAYGRSPKDC